MLLLILLLFCLFNSIQFDSRNSVSKCVVKNVSKLMFLFPRLRGLIVDTKTFVHMLCKRLEVTYRRGFQMPLSTWLSRCSSFSRIIKRSVDGLNLLLSYVFVLIVTLTVPLFSRDFTDLIYY